MDNKKDNNINVLGYIVIVLFSFIISFFVLKFWNKLSKNEKRKIIKYSIYIYLLFAAIGLIFAILSAIEEK